MRNEIYLIDAYARIYRGYHALPPMGDSKGRPTSALFAMGKFLLSFDESYHPEYGAVVYDLGEPVVRTAILPEYKANRAPMPDDLREQLDAIRDLVAAFGYPILEIEGREADDVLAALASEFVDFAVKIVSSDKDLAQVIDGRVEMLVPERKGGGLSRRGVREVEDKFGVSPEQIVDYLALIGDASDNIAGVSGVGAKTASSLLAEFGSVDGVYADLGAVKREKLRESLRDSEGIVKRNIELVRLDRSLPDDTWRDIGILKRRSPDWGVLLSMARDYDLTTLARAFESRMASSSVDSGVPSGSGVAVSVSTERVSSPGASSSSVTGDMFTPDFFGDG